MEFTQHLQEERRGEETGWWQLAAECGHLAKPHHETPRGWKAKRRIERCVFLLFFQIENSSDEFALYIVHTSGERTKLKDSDYPLIARILQGPCEAIAKIFLMEKDLGEEVTYD
ncbi:hypothetical protein chiPu_0021341, partial [Chiloscyllium punctatum]|nr:hypothetical protein [Chiloscyllium punctatum]